MLQISPGEYHPDAHTDFLLSIGWRKPDAISDRTAEILVELQRNPDLTRVASSPWWNCPDRRNG